MTARRPIIIRTDSDEEQTRKSEREKKDVFKGKLSEFTPNIRKRKRRRKVTVKLEKDDDDEYLGSKKQKEEMGEMSDDRTDEDANEEMERSEESEESEAGKESDEDDMIHEGKEKDGDDAIEEGKEREEDNYEESRECEDMPHIDRSHTPSPKSPERGSIKSSDDDEIIIKSNLPLHMRVSTPSKASLDTTVPFIDPSLSPIIFPAPSPKMSKVATQSSISQPTSTSQSTKSKDHTSQDSDFQYHTSQDSELEYRKKLNLSNADLSPSHSSDVLQPKSQHSPLIDVETVDSSPRHSPLRDVETRDSSPLHSLSTESPHEQFDFSHYSPPHYDDISQHRIVEKK